MNSSNINYSRLEKLLNLPFRMTLCIWWCLTKLNINDDIRILDNFGKVNRWAEHIAYCYIAYGRFVFESFKFTGVATLKITRDYFVIRMSDIISNATIFLKFWIVLLILTRTLIHNIYKYPSWFASFNYLSFIYQKLLFLKNRLTCLWLL